MFAALTIAGSDSGGGAGIQADLRAFSSLGVHGSSVLTCVTSQNTVRVGNIYPLPVEQVLSQMDAVLEDIEISAVKTGMLYSAPIARAVIGRLEEEDLPLVIDPVMVAGVGDPLHVSDFVEALRGTVVPAAHLLTPNRQEAEAITGTGIDSESSARAACRELVDMGAGSVLLKGGHMDGEEAVDLLLHDDQFHRFSSPRLDLRGHGGGCTLSSYIAGFTARGAELLEAVSRGKESIWQAYSTSYRVGKGVDIVDSSGPLRREAMRYTLMRDLEAAVREVETILPMGWVPEVGMNFVHALPGALSPSDVCGVQGRISVVEGRLTHPRCLSFGASKHVATIVLTAMRFDPGVRSALNLRYSEAHVQALKDSNLTLGSFDRADEPEEGSTMEWGTYRAISDLQEVPDAIFDRGGVGKEPMIRLLGESPEEVLVKLRAIIQTVVQ
ncbi:MAG: bifunctional hydroxymethylpyrimidine kinase/phosphomethylpyrimidine kinase [Methanomassiliicoccales archaeon]